MMKTQAYAGENWRPAIPCANIAGFVRTPLRTTIESRREHEVPNIKSQKKRVLTNEKARQKNRSVKSEIKTASKKVDDAVAAGDAAAAKEAAQSASRLLDKAVSKGVVHKNTAANHKSSITKRANSVEG